MKKYAYRIGIAVIALSILLQSGCGEVKSELRYDYTKNLTCSGEDKAGDKIFAIAIKVMKAVNLCQEEVDLSEFDDMPDIVIDMGLQAAVQADPMCSFAVLNKKEGGVYSVEYLGGTEEHKSRVAQFEKQIKSILDACVVPDDEEQTVRQLYDYFVREMEYNYALLDHKEAAYLTQEKMVTKFDPLINQTGVCSGFAKSFAFLLNQIGIENYLVSDRGSTAIFASNNPVFDGQPDTTGHMWNLIKVNDEFYHFDITFEIGVIEEWEDEYGNDHIGVKSGKNHCHTFITE